MFHLSLEEVLLRAGAYIIIASVFGWCSAMLLYVLGNRTVLHDGRLTLNPGSHFDIVGFIGAILFKQGWIRPIYPDPASVKGGRGGLVLWIIGSLLLTLVAIAILRFLRIPVAMLSAGTLAQGLTALLNTMSDVGLWFVVLNILPIPPLLGSNFLVAIVPAWRERMAGLYWPGAALLALLLVTGVAQNVLQPAVTLLSRWVLL